MRRYSRRQGLFLMIAFCVFGCRPDGQEIHLYILAGQSNMAGRGQVATIDTTVHRRVFTLTDDISWKMAREPLHFDKPEIAGVGPGFSFGRAMAEAEPGVVIGLIPTAVGGSSIRAWQPGRKHRRLDAHPYDDALSRITLAQRLSGGEHKGIIWHQGESDREMAPAEYLRRLEELILRFRSDLGDPDLPVVVGELGHFFVDREPRAAGINDALRELPSRVAHTAVISAEGLGSKSDSVHFDAASARQLGRRYASAMTQLRQVSFHADDLNGRLPTERPGPDPGDSPIDPPSVPD